MKKPLKIFTWPYELESPWHGPDHPGILLKVEWPQQVIGYADVHPWAELGDENLEAQIKSLTDIAPLPLIKRAIAVAFQDGVARREGRSLYSGFKIPFSHLLVPDFLTIEASDLNYWREQGYRYLKVKIGNDLESESKQLHKMVEGGGGDFKWRLDFNASLTPEEFNDWLMRNKDLWPVIDSIEDPASGEARVETQSVPLFADRAGDFENWHRVIKPETEDIPTRRPGQRLILTNNLGHPYGHGVAMALAARAGTDEVCGLQGLQHYAPSTWTEQVRYHGPVCLPPVGTGFGFDALLKKLQWSRQI